MRRTALVPVLLLASAALVAAPAAPARDAAAPRLTAASAAVQPGGVLTLHGRAFPSEQHVALLAGPAHGKATRIGGALTGRAGRFTATIHVRPRASAGAFVVRACLDACRVQASAPFRIAAR